jgi:hypothetical protein
VPDGQKPVKDTDILSLCHGIERPAQRLEPEGVSHARCAFPKIEP